jgi:signal transduction histidine kinase
LDELLELPLPKDWKRKWLFSFHLFFTEAYTIAGNFEKGYHHAQLALHFIWQSEGDETFVKEEALLALQEVLLGLSLSDTTSIRLSEQERLYLQTQLNILEREIKLKEAQLNVSRVFVCLSGTTLLLVLVTGGAGWWIYQTRKKAKMERLQAEAIQLAASKERELSLLREQLYTNITHELRTPLTLIISPLQKLTEQKSQKEIEVALRHANELLHKFNDILQWNKLESKAMFNNPVVGDVATEAAKVISRFAEIAAQKEIDLDFRFAETAFWGSLDFEKFDTILSNLLENALKYTDKGKSIDVALDFQERPQHSLRLVVTDTGEGIPNELLPDIFNRFKQAGKFSQRTGGVGIGLTLSKGLTELMGGRIGVASTLGTGTAFEVILPFPPANTNATPTASATATEPAGQSEKAHPLLLLVEDHNELKMFLSSVLGDEYELFHAETAKDGIHLAKKHVRDLILTDIMLPGS